MSIAAMRCVGATGSVMLLGATGGVWAWLHDAQREAPAPVERAGLTVGAAGKSMTYVDPFRQKDGIFADVGGQVGYTFKVS